MIRDLDHLKKATQQCFKSAEDKLRSEVMEKHFASNEEFLTKLFWGELGHQVKIANQHGLWSDALANDLSHAFHHRVSAHELKRDFDGLFCEARLHDHQREASTGGDFALFTSLPQLQSGYSYRGECCTLRFQDRALLVQSKLAAPRKRRPALKKKQAETLPSYGGAAALLLYRYTDSRHEQLASFCWKSCIGCSEKDLNDWLGECGSGTIYDSDQVIKDLFSGKIGTHDEEMIEDIMLESSPKPRPKIELHFYWSDGRPPEQSIELSNYLNVTVQERVMLLA